MCFSGMMDGNYSYGSVPFYDPILKKCATCWNFGKCSKAIRKALWIWCLPDGIEYNPDITLGTPGVNGL